jgi:hypothetical protein
VKLLDLLAGVGVASVVLGTTAVTHASPEPAPIEAPVDQADGIHVVLVADTLPKATRTRVTADLERQLEKLAAEHGLVITERESATLVVRIELVQPEPGIVLVQAIAIHDAEVLQRDDTRPCIQCTTVEIVEDATRIIPDALSLLAERRAEDAAAAIAAAQAAEEAAMRVEAPLPEASSSKPARVLGPVGYVGIASSVLGVGATIGGAVLLARGRVEDVQGPVIHVTDYRPPGRALVGVGLGMFVVGNVLFAVDLTVLAQGRRARAQAKLDHLSFTLIDGGPGFVAGGRF